MTPFHLTRAQVRDLDRRAIHEFGVPGVVLMENAGRGAAELLARLNSERQRVLILCGPGNNGGDGFVIARHLDARGWPVEVRLFADPAKLSPDAATNLVPIQRSGIPTLVYRAVTGQRVDVIPVLSEVLNRPCWIVDALFGTGLARPLGVPYDQIVALVNAGGRPVLAVDIPSGLDCDIGEPLGPTIRAAHTATFVAPKAGFRNPNARPWLGEVHVLDIGAPKKLVDEYLNQRSEVRGQKSHTDL
jgi:NAD(P)H-hydrate epimerase